MESSLSASVMFPLTCHPVKHVGVNYRSPRISRKTCVLFRDTWLCAPEKHSWALTQASVPLSLRQLTVWKSLLQGSQTEVPGARQSLTMPAAHSWGPRSMGETTSPRKRSAATHSRIVLWCHVGRRVRTFVNQTFKWNLPIFIWLQLFQIFQR